MDEQYRVEDLAAEEIAELLSMDGVDLTEAQADALHDFIQRVGGFENARAAVEMLLGMDKAA